MAKARGGGGVAEKEKETPLAWSEVLLMAPAAWLEPFDLKLQVYLYLLYHSSWVNSTVHMLTMTPIVWSQLLVLPHACRWVWAFAVALFSVVSAGAVGAVVGVVVVGMCATADLVEDALKLGCVLCAGLVALQTLAHAFDERVPPIANGSRRQWSTEVGYFGTSTLVLARNFVIGFALEFLASPKCLVVQALIVLNTVLGPTTEWWTELQDVVRAARRDPHAPIDRVPEEIVGDQHLKETVDEKTSLQRDSPRDDVAGATNTKVLAALLLPFVVTMQVLLGLLVRAPPPAPREHHLGPEPAALEDVDEMRGCVRRSEPFVVRCLKTAIDELELPPPSPTRRGELAVTHDARDFPILHAFARQLFGAWRWRLSIRPLWFTGNYERGTAHIDTAVPSVNFYCLKRGSKRVVLFPASSNNLHQNDLVLGTDQIYLPGSHDGDDAWIDDAKKHGHVYDFHLHAGEALFFNSSASLHQFTNLEPDCAAYSMRLFALTAAPPVKRALICGPFNSRWQATKHGVANILHRRTIRPVFDP